MKLQKFSLITFFSFFCFSSIVADFAQIDRVRVQHCKKEIAREILKNNYARLGFIVAGTAIAGFGGYKMFFADPSRPSNTLMNYDKDLLLQKMSTEVNAIKSQVSHLYETQTCMKEFLIDQGYSIGGSGSWGAWLKGWIKYFGRQSIALGLLSVVTGTMSPFTKYFKSLDNAVDSAIGKIFHAGDLNWYINTHTNLFSMLSHLEKTAQTIDTEGIDQADHSYQKEEFTRSWNLCIKQLEGVIGFIEYKGDELRKNSLMNAQRADALVKHLEEKMAEICATLQEHFNGYRYGMSLKSVMENAHAYIQDSCSTFTTIEQFVLYN
jgi:hypothetical protein